MLKSPPLSFRNKQDDDPNSRALFAERVFKAVIDPATGQPRELYLPIFKTLMVTADQVRDLKQEDFKQEDVSDKIAQIRFKFHKQ